MGKNSTNSTKKTTSKPKQTTEQKLAEATVTRAKFPKNKKFFWVFFVLSALSLLVGVALLPAWKNVDVIWNTLSEKSFSLILCSIIMVYIIGFLIRQVIREPKTPVKILTVFEAGFFFAIAIGCVLQFANLVDIADACTIIGAAVWSRGIVYIVKAYLCKHEESDSYPLWMLILSIGLVTLGTIMISSSMIYHRPVFGHEHLVWFVAISLILGSFVFMTFGIISKPKKKKKEAPKKDEKASLGKSKKSDESLEKGEEASVPALVDASDKKE